MWIKRISFIIVFTIICTIGFYICGLIYPNIINQDDNSLYSVILVLHWVVSLPCYVIVGIFAYLSHLYLGNKFFNFKTARIVKNTSIIMLCDIVSFLILFIVCLRLSLLNEIQTHIAILLFGFLVTILLLFLYGHIKKIAQEEEDLEGLV